MNFLDSRSSNSNAQIYHVQLKDTIIKNCKTNGEIQSLMAALLAYRQHLLAAKFHNLMAVFENRKHLRFQ